jgi:murein DD-endopeptidase MepM/ murein hydrolase activator NlpD
LNANKNTFRLGILVVPLLIFAGVAGFFLFKRMEGTPPAATLGLATASLGASQTIPLTVADPKSGIRKVWVALVKDGQEIVLLDKTFASAGILTGGVTREERLEIPFEPRSKGIGDGKALLRLRVQDYSWRQWGKGNLAEQEQEVMIDTRPPSIEVLSKPHYFAQGGAGLVIYKLSEACPTSGVQVGEAFYPGQSGFFKDAAIYMTMVAIDWQQGPNTPMNAIATDLAGNQTRSGISHLINPRTFKRDQIEISDSFLDWKMPEFVQQVNAMPGSSNLDIFLKVNGELRRANYEVLKKVLSKSDAQIYWKDDFLRLPNAAPRAGFADTRSYMYQGKKIDEQTHLGVDLASLEQSPVPAGNSGKVVFAENLGIYGQTVIIDHGMGLFSMYSHLSHIGVTVGQMVAKGDTLGKTGTSGLAGGDHLHYSVLVYHTFVNPLAWWDPQWIQNNISSKIDALNKP